MIAIIGAVPPLSTHALAALAYAAKRPLLTQEVNPGIVRKLTDEGWCTIEQVPSPFKSHRPGTQVQALVATEKGEARIAYEERDHG